MTSIHKPVPDAPRSIHPTEMRYIKLGPSGAWAERCLRDGLIELGHSAIPHDLPAAGDWEAVQARYEARGVSPAKAKDFTRELRDFYALPESALWITLAQGKLWWAFAHSEVVPVVEEGCGARRRRAIGGWRSTALAGQPLFIDTLSTRLTKVAAYRQTVCRVEQADYLIRRINGQPEPLVAEALAAEDALVAAAQGLIQALHWKDFELLVDLIFAGSGWRRISAVGGSAQADSDLILEQAATGERAMVQVKSSASQAVLDDYADRCKAGGWDRCFFVCHTPAGALAPTRDDRFHLWLGETLAHQAVKAGLVPWLIARNR